MRNKPGCRTTEERTTSSIAEQSHVTFWWLLLACIQTEEEGRALQLYVCTPRAQPPERWHPTQMKHLLQLVCNSADGPHHSHGDPRLKPSELITVFPFVLNWGLFGLPASPQSLSHHQCLAVINSNLFLIYCDNVSIVFDSLMLESRLLGIQFALEGRTCCWALICTPLQFDVGQLFLRCVLTTHVSFALCFSAAPLVIFSTGSYCPFVSEQVFKDFSHSICPSSLPLSLSFSSW